MPELPEVETTCLAIAPLLIGQTIEQVIVRQASLRYLITDQLINSAKNQGIQAVSRRAKYLLIQLTSGTILIHLGMSGHLQVVDCNKAPQKHDHIDIRLSNQQCLRYTDPRRFGFLLFATPDFNHHPLLQSLGPEPLENIFTGDYLYQQCHQKKTVIKRCIMDNKVVVGIGNIYATESLFLANLHPETPCQQLTQKQWQTLAITIKQVLEKALQQGGTTLRDYYQIDGKPGYFSQQLLVYGRVKQPCFYCSTPIDSVKIGQRSSAFCPHCQPFNGVKKYRLLNKKRVIL